MTSPHHAVTVVTKGKGHSAVRAAAYRHATKMKKEDGRLTKDYGAKKNELAHSEIALPADAEQWIRDLIGAAAFKKVCEEIRAELGQSENDAARFPVTDGVSGSSNVVPFPKAMNGNAEATAGHHGGQEGLAAPKSKLTEEEIEREAWARLSERLWRSVSQAEKRLNKFPDKAQVARSVTIALPKMLEREHQIEAVRSFITAAYTKNGMVADWVLHDKGDGNPHVHIMLTLRDVGETDWSRLKNRNWNKVALLREWRELWAEHANLVLQREGFRDRVDHRSLQSRQKELGLEPKLHPRNQYLHADDHADLMGQTEREEERLQRVDQANAQTLREAPEYILVFVQSYLSFFTRGDVRAAFVKQLRLSSEADAWEANHLTDRVMASPYLIDTIGHKNMVPGERYYQTKAKALQLQQLVNDTGRLATSHLRDTWSPKEPVLRLVENSDAVPVAVADDGVDVGAASDHIDSGNGDIKVDISAFIDLAALEAATKASNKTESPDDEQHRFRPRKEVVAEKRKRMRRSKGPAVKEVKQHLQDRAADLFEQAFGPPLRASDAAWRPKDQTSIVMQMRGTKKGLWHDHSSGEGGDLLDLVAQHFLGKDRANQDFPKVLEAAARFCGIVGTAALETDAEAQARLADKRSEREKQDAMAAAQQRRQREVLIEYLRQQTVGLQSKDASAAAALAYLSSRGIEQLPNEGLAALRSRSQSEAPRGLRDADHEALVVFAYNSEGVVTGGQRILLQGNGQKAEVDVRKPSFGAITGSVAKFSARDDSKQSGPLVIAEGPESALSIWQATGLETWAVFGVSNWKNAPLPLDREVILAPDRDLPASPAGRAFRKAVAHHLARGCNLKVAVAPELRGSKRDLNDTAMRAGDDAVRAAIAAARVVKPWLSPTLNGAQLNAAEAMLNTDRLTMVMGYAGTGKTYTLEEVARVWRERGLEVLAGAPSGKATQALSQIPGVQARTLAGWESQWARGETPERNQFVFIMDEAGMVGSGQWARLQSLIGSLGGKLIAVGDPEQLQPVNESSGWRRAEREVRERGGTVPVMNVVRRQRDARDREATVALAEGDRDGIKFALDHYEQKGAFVFGAPDPIAAIAKDFVKGIADDEVVHLENRVALAATHADVAALNKAILETAGLAGVVDRKNAKVWSVEKVERSVGSDGLEISTRGLEDIEVGVGGRIMLTRPHKEYDLSRSSFGTVTAIEDNRFCLRMDGDDRELWIDPKAFRYFTYGFAATVHKAQGMTVDQTFVLAHKTMDRFGLNVALTRHRDRVTVYGQPKHCETFAELTRLTTRRQYQPRFQVQRGDQPLVPLPAAVFERADWEGRDTPLPPGALLADRQLMSVATRVAGLLGADHADNDPIFKPVADGDPDYREYPTRAIEVLVARQGVFTADEVAQALAQQVNDPATFLRLFTEAMSHHDLVQLPRAGGRAGDYEVRVFTTSSQLQTEMSAVDRGLALSLRKMLPTLKPIAIPDAEVLAGDDLDAEQHAILRDLYSPLGVGAGGSGLAIIEGKAGTGKTRLAAAVAQVERYYGRGVLVISSSEAGREALRGEGIEAVTITEHLRSFFEPSNMPKNRLVILDDANALSAAYSDVLLSRIETEGDRLLAFVNPDRRPMRAGPTFQKLAERLRIIDQGTEGSKRLATLSGLHGASTNGLVNLRSGLRGDTQEVLATLRDALARGVICDVRDREQAIRLLAQAYVSDDSENKVALGWSRRDAAALTEAIRAELDSTYSERQASPEIEHGASKGLRPHDRIRFSTSGTVRAINGTNAADEVQLQRGEVATVLKVEADTMTLRVSNAQGAEVRDITIATESVLPRWNFALASTITATAGRRQASVHLLGSAGMDCHTIEAAVTAASENFFMVLPVDDGKQDRVLKTIATRRREARSTLNYGFDPSQTIAMAREEAAYQPYIGGYSETQKPNLVLDDDATDLTSGLPTIGLGTHDVSKANEAYVREHPDHVLLQLAADQAVFTVLDIRQALRVHGGAEWSESDIKAIAGDLIRSSDLVQLPRRAPDGSVQYMTPARAAVLNNIGEVAAQLATQEFAPGHSNVLRPTSRDILEHLNDGQAVAAEAMLSTRRLTLVTGRAGTGKTYTLKAVAEEWRARGIKVLAGASSGKATAELRGVPKLEAETLASWEARWAKNEVPTEPFVFIMDEAGMVEVGQWQRIQKQVMELGGKFIAVGDPDQLQPVSGLSGWDEVERRAGGSVAIHKVLRQTKDTHRIATQFLASGGPSTAEALAIYEQEGAVKLDAATSVAPVKALAEAFVNDELANPTSDLASQRRQLALAFSNRDVGDLNDAIRALRLQTANAALRIPGGNKGGALSLDPETQQKYGIIRRPFIDQEGKPDEKLLARFLAVGDRVMTTAKLSPDVAKSSFGTVVETREEQITVAFDELAEPVVLDRKAIEQLDYGYAATIHKSQGLTADDVYLLTHRRMHRHATYVAMSRHRDTLTIFGRAGHVEHINDLTRLAEAPGSLEMGPEDIDQIKGRERVAGMSAESDPVARHNLDEWSADLDNEQRDLRTTLLRDPEVLAVAERISGLMAAARHSDLPIIKDDISPALERYVTEPQAVIDDLLRRQSVIRADDIADTLARTVNDPTTFLRLFAQAMAHPALIRLGETDAKGSSVFSTKAQLQAEVRAADLGVHLALHSGGNGAPKGTLQDALNKDRLLKSRVAQSDRQDVSEILSLAMAPKRLRLIRGNAGSGKTTMAAQIGTAHAAVGWDVVTLAPTGAGLSALERVGVAKPLTVDRFLQRTDLAAPSSDSTPVDSIPLSAASVVIVDNATLLDGGVATSLLERVAASGAKLICMVGGEEHTPFGSGPLLRALETRVGAVDLGADRARSASQAAVLRDLLDGGKPASDAIARLEDNGQLKSGGDARRAIAALAKSYVEDAASDKIALVWSRADAKAVTQQIRVQLDQRHPAQRKWAAKVGPDTDLKIGDRIRFLANSEWTFDKDQRRRRVLAGETAEVTAVNAKTNGFMLRITERDGVTQRKLHFSPEYHEVLPQWDFDFAGTIHSQGGKLHRSVHLLAASGMSRQVLAAGVAAHRDQLTIVVPSAAARMSQVLGRVCRRDARAESALDYGFDPTLAARAAMRSQDPLAAAVRAESTSPTPEPSAIESIIDQLAKVAGLKRSPHYQALPSDVEGDAFAEVVGATLDLERETSRPCRISDRETAEQLIRSLADRKQWREILGQVPAGVSEAAVALASSQVPEAREFAEAKDVADQKSKRAIHVAHFLARGALAADALGEHSVAEIFERALMRYGRKATVAARLNGETAIADDAVQRLSARVDIIAQREALRHEERQPTLTTEPADKTDEIGRLALQLAIGVSERVAAYHGSHRRDLVRDINLLLRKAKVADLPQAKVENLTKELCDVRVTYDAKRDFAAAVVKDDPRGERFQEFNETVFAVAIAGRGYSHPLEFAHEAVQDAYDRGVAAAVRMALSMPSADRRAEQAVARAAALPALSRPDRALVTALQFVFERGSLRDVNSLRDERNGLVEHLRAGKVPSDGSMVRRLFQAFTHREIAALVNPAQTPPDSLPLIAEGDRRRVSDNLANAIPTSYNQSIYEPWHEFEKKLQHKVHPELVKEGRGMSL